MIDKCIEAKVPVYISPVVQEGDIYDTGPIMMNHKQSRHGIVALYGTTNEMAYIKLLVMYSCDSFRDQLERVLWTNYRGEYLCEKSNRVNNI